MYIVTFALIFVLTSFVEEIFRRKNWYNPRFWYNIVFLMYSPPDNYVRGPLSRD